MRARLAIGALSTLTSFSCGPMSPSGSHLSADTWQPALGTGVNFSETQTFRTCVNEIEPQQTPLALSRLYQETRIRSKRDLHKALNVSASLSAKGQWGGGSLGLSYFNDIEMQDEAFYWLVDAHYAVTDERLLTNGTFDLTPAAKSILQHEGVEAFYQACGTHFYSGRQIGGRYTLIYEFNSREDKVVERLKSRAQYGDFGLQAKASFASFLSLAEKASLLRVHTRIVGGGDQIKNYAKEPEKLEEELQTLRSDILIQRRGVVLRWFVSSYDMFEEVIRKKREEGITSGMDDFREDALEFYYNLYTDNQSHIKYLIHRLEMAKAAEPFYLYSEEKIQNIKDIIKAYQSQNDALKQVAVDCLRGKNLCPTKDFQTLALNVPRVDKDLSSLGSWQIYPLILDAHTAVSRVNFVGTPAAGYKSRIFDTGGLFFTSASGAFAILQGPQNHPETFSLGSLQRVVDPSSGISRPAICTGDMARNCNLRIVENPAIVMGDGYPVAKILLSIFDEHGFVKASSTYLLTK